MRNLHKLTLITCFLFVLNVAFAQDSLQKKHLILKIAPLTMFDIDNTFEFAAEHRLGKQNRWTLSEQLGYGQGKANLWGNIYTYGPFRETLRARLEARRYAKNSPLFTGRYVAYEVFYKQINDQLTNNIGRECENGPCNYYENLDYSVSKYVFGGNAKIGYQAIIRDENKKNTNFIFDFYVGLGLRRVLIDHRVGAINNNQFGLYRGNGIFSNDGLGYGDKKYNIPHLAFGIKLGYIVF